MKIVVANKYLYPRGGDCMYTLQLIDLLRRKSHAVVPFSMHHSENITTEYERYFVPHIDFREELRAVSPQSAWRVLSRAIVNREAVRRFRQLLEDVEPDIVHLQNIHHQLTPAIIDVPYQMDIPVVWTLHDYILHCPDHTFLRNGKICDLCSGGAYINAVIHRCKKGSLAASLVAGLESAVYAPHKLATKVAWFLCPSQFLASVLTKNGIPRNQVDHVPNFLPVSEITSTGQDYFLFVGRLSGEKGIDTLLDAFHRLGAGRLLIVGDGPERARLEALVTGKNIRGVEFLGRQSPDRVRELLAGCLASVVPSTCWENFPYTVLEAMAAQKPVIASRIGGIPEQVDHEQTGLLFKAGNSTELTGCLSRLYDNPAYAAQLGKTGRQKVREQYNEEIHYGHLINIYQQVTLGRAATRQVTKPAIPV